MEDKTYIFEGKTTNEAIENGLKELKVSKNKVEIKVLEQEDKKSFFSILTPRVVKVEMKLKDNIQTPVKPNKKREISDKDIEEATNKIDSFVKDFIKNFEKDELTYEIKNEDDTIKIDLNGKNTGFLIGYRGEVLNSFQTILNNIANKEIEGKIKVLLNVSGYREKREKDLQILATKIASSVIKNKKKIVLEPMSAYERKIIHTKLQENDKVKTYSIGEEPYRKVVIELQ